MHGNYVKLAEPKDTTRENILAEAGYEQVYDIDEIITRMPSPAEISRLGILPGTPVAEHIRTGYSATDKPVRMMISIIPGHTLILQCTIPT
jgi:GntR family transcriptional regulator